ncbi:uncharacterized protein LOC131605721 [Vicia villosa]|uniref:uncharacterized protein LOC131605721 n=1 Tax=Vicia villosa TaxID=3911 RepID=UPI00273C4594|nr:uncharacterized protein LOC131605721 [Vicia villosa]
MQELQTIHSTLHYITITDGEAEWKEAYKVLIKFCLREGGKWDPKSCTPVIILSYNIRGGGNRAKRKRVGFLIQKGDVDICFIQETKLSGIGVDVIRELWGGVDVEWSYLDVNGASGGILTMWKKDLFSLIYSFRGEGFLGLCVEKEVTRRRTWNYLCEFKNNNAVGSWCIGGDFNSISTLDERIGVNTSDSSRDLRSFNEFIKDMELVDLPTIGGKFTWFKSNGKAMSRLDRFLLSESLVDDWKVDGQCIGERDVSDHAPIWLKNNRKDWGPKPLKFNNLWFRHEEFFKFVEDVWDKIEVKGRGDYCLVQKLKILRSRISWWNKTVYGWIDLNIDKDVKELHSLDNLFVHFAGNVPEEVVEKRLKVVEDLWNNLNKKKGFLD